MLPATKIIGEVQSNIGDLKMELIQEGEYLDMFNSILREVSEKTETWIARYSQTPIPTGTVPANPVFAIYVPYSDTNGIIAPHHILRVLRQNGLASIETREYSFQAISSTQGGNNSFIINDYDLGNFAFNSQRDGTDGFILNFAIQLAVGETIFIDFVTGSPYNLNVWDESTAGKGVQTLGLAMTQQFTNQGGTASVVLPDYLYEPIKYGLSFKALERLFLKGDDKQKVRMEYMKAEYTNRLLMAQSYARLPKDNNSRLQIQPINWLPE